MSEISNERLNRDRLQRLAERYVSDAAILFDNGRWSSAYYLAGYAIECALKACIAKQMREHDFPDLKLAKDAHIHRLNDLLKLAGLKSHYEEYSRVNLQFRDYWAQIILEWSTESRYQDHTQKMAEEMVTAVRDNEDGVLAWIKQYW